MKVIATINTTKKDWTRAIADSWYLTFNEKLLPKKIQTLNNTEDFRRVVSEINGIDIKIEIVEQENG